MTGGMDPGTGKRLASTELLTFSGGAEWKSSVDLPVATNFLSSATFGTSFFVTGGSEGNILTAILQWNPSSEVWDEVASMTEQRFKHATAVVLFDEISLFCDKPISNKGV